MSCSQDLEGSRFGTSETTALYLIWAPIFPREVFNRRLPRINPRRGNAMRHSREPLVFARFRGTNLEAKVARVARYTPKRLPSRLGVFVCSSCNSQIVDDDYDYERTPSNNTSIPTASTKTRLTKALLWKKARLIPARSRLAAALCS